MRNADLASLESELVTERARLSAGRLKALFEIYADLEEAELGADYGKAALEVKLPTFTIARSTTRSATTWRSPPRGGRSEHVDVCRPCAEAMTERKTALS